MCLVSKVERLTLRSVNLCSQVKEHNRKDPAYPKISSSLDPNKRDLNLNASFHQNFEYVDMKNEKKP